MHGLIRQKKKAPTIFINGKLLHDILKLEDLPLITEHLRMLTINNGFANQYLLIFINLKILKMKNLISKFSQKLLSNQQLKSVKGGCGGTPYCFCQDGSPVRCPHPNMCGGKVAC
ncbi:MAG: hypothetical protein Mars2KO_10490 [Maribacter sp.]